MTPAPRRPRSYHDTVKFLLTAQATYCIALEAATLASGSGIINAETLGFLLNLQENVVTHAERAVQSAPHSRTANAAARLRGAISIREGIQAEIDRLLDEAESDANCCPEA